MSDRLFYFVRPNGNTTHNDPSVRGKFMRGEPPEFPATRFNYAQKCLTDGFIRIGWPGTGPIDPDTIEDNPTAGSYDDLPRYVRTYLRQFAEAPAGSVILMPDKSARGRVYIGSVLARRENAPPRRSRSAVFVGRRNIPYHYFHDVPRGEWFECAHRLSVRWDSDGRTWREFDAEDLGLPYPHGFWRRAFACINHQKNGERMIRRIERLSA